VIDHLLNLQLLAQEGPLLKSPENAAEVIEVAIDTVASSPSWANFGYLVAAVLFIHPRTAVRGNQLGALGMLLAVLVVMLSGQVVSWPVAFVGMLVGTAGGIWLANTVQMTQMPQFASVGGDVQRVWRHCFGACRGLGAYQSLGPRLRRFCGRHDGAHRLGHLYRFAHRGRQAAGVAPVQKTLELWRATMGQRWPAGALPATRVVHGRRQRRRILLFDRPRGARARRAAGTAHRRGRHARGDRATK